MKCVHRAPAVRHDGALAKANRRIAELEDERDDLHARLRTFLDSLQAYVDGNQPETECP